MTTPSYQYLAALFARLRSKERAIDQFEADASHKAKASRDAAMASALLAVAYIFLAAAVFRVALLAFDLWNGAQRLR